MSEDRRFTMSEDHKCLKRHVDRLRQLLTYPHPELCSWQLTVQKEHDAIVALRPHRGS